MNRTESGVLDVVRIGIAQGAVVRSPQRLRTTGLGSCVGVVVYDFEAGVAGMVHVMLPAPPETGAGSVKKYAETAVPWLVDAVLREAGTSPLRLKAKLAGGAQMFATAAQSDLMRIGPRNVEAVLRALDQCSVPVIAQDVGGNVGRTIEFDTGTSCLWIRTALRGSYVI